MCEVCFVTNEKVANTLGVNHSRKVGPNPYLGCLKSSVTSTTAQKACAVDNVKK